MNSDARGGRNRHDLMLNALTMLVTIAVCLLAAEVALRFLPWLHRCTRFP
jgi:hypothetical protein